MALSGACRTDFSARPHRDGGLVAFGGAFSPNEGGGGSHWALCLSDVHFLALLHHCGPVALFKADAAFPHFRMGGRLGMHGILGAAGADCALFAFGQRYAPLSSDVSRGNRPRLCSYGTRQGVI